MFIILPSQHFCLHVLLQKIHKQSYKADKYFKRICGMGEHRRADIHGFRGGYLGIWIIHQTRADRMDVV